MTGDSAFTGHTPDRVRGPPDRRPGLTLADRVRGS
jgi:hypothetical protein